MMILEKPSNDIIWRNDIPTLFFESSTLLFSVFHVDPMLDKEESLQQLKKVYEALLIRLRPWIDHYIWNTKPPRVELVEYNSVDYIFGELTFADSIEDQWLITHILFEFSKTYPDLYIHLHDNEGEFLLIESHEQLPEWLGPENDANRDWINNGRILIIPQEYYQDRGLKLQEALKFLERAVYKCSSIPEIDNHIKRKLDSYPTKALELQCQIEVSVPRRIAGLIMRENVLNRAVLKYSKESFVLEDSKDSKETKETEEETVDLNVRTTVMTYLLIDYYLKSHGLTGFKRHGSRVVTKSIENYDIEAAAELPTDEEIKKYNEQGDVLQDELIRLLRIPNRVSPKLTFEQENSDVINEDDLMEKLQGFFEDTEAGFGGVENDTKTKEEFNPSTKLEELDESDEEDDGYAKGDDFLGNNGLDIDEDDFFEFFAKEALKLSDEDIKEFRNMRLDESSSQASEPHDDQANDSDFNYDDNDDDDDDDEEEEQELSHEDLKALAEMLQSLKGGEGPAAAFLNTLGGSL